MAVYKVVAEESLVVTYFIEADSDDEAREHYLSRTSKGNYGNVICSKDESGTHKVVSVVKDRDE